MCETTASRDVDANEHALHWWNATAAPSFGVIFKSTDSGLSSRKYARSLSLYACGVCMSLRMIVPSAFGSGRTLTSTSSGRGRSNPCGRGPRGPPDCGRGPRDPPGCWRGARAPPPGCCGRGAKPLPCLSRRSSRSAASVKCAGLLTPAAFFAQSGVKSILPKSRIDVSLVSIAPILYHIFADAAPQPPFFARRTPSRRHGCASRRRGGAAACGARVRAHPAAKRGL